MPESISLPWIGFYGFCLLAGLLWVQSLRRFWVPLAVALVGLLGVAGMVGLPGAALLGLTAFTLWVGHGFRRYFTYAPAFYAVGVVLVIGLSAHLLPGFTAWPLVGPVQLSPGAASYSRWFSADKAFAGLLFLAYVGPTAYLGMQWKRLMVETLPIALVTMGAVFALALGFGFVAFAPKWTPLVVTFALSNLFLTCISEEVVFRRIIQGTLVEWLEGFRYRSAVAIVVAGALFGLAHLGGGAAYAALAFVAGVGYGYAFHATRQIESAILAHFTLNLAHFLFLTYPVLA
jgi:membrane protease YdiL (CAAX protease family)